MKICEVTHRYPPNVGGVENHVEQISTRLADRGHEVTVVTADADRFEITDNGIRVVRQVSLSPGDNYHFNPAFYLLDKRSDFDVIHVHNYHSFPSVLTTLGSKTKVVFTPHFHAGSSSTLRAMLLTPYAVLGRKALRKAESVIAVSQWEADELERQFSVDPVVIPNGLDYSEIYVDNPEGKRPFVLCAGRLEEYKGVQYAIDSLSHHDYDLIIAGDGPYKDELKTYVRQSGLSHRVAFLGRISDTHLDRLYRTATAFINMSEFESSGMTVAEALSRGTPCVISGYRGLSQWSSHRGVTAAIRDGKSIADAISAVSDEPVNRYPLPDWDEVVDEVEQLL